MERESRTTFSGGKERGHQARGVDARGSFKSRRKQEATERTWKGAGAQRRVGKRGETERGRLFIMFDELFD